MQTLLPTLFLDVVKTLHLSLTQRDSLQATMSWNCDYPICKQSVKRIAGLQLMERKQLAEAAHAQASEQHASKASNAFSFSHTAQ